MDAGAAAYQMTIYLTEFFLMQILQYGLSDCSTSVLVLHM